MENVQLPLGGSRSVVGWDLALWPTTKKSNLHHENDCVQCDHDHDEVLERRRDDEAPDAELERPAVLRHVATRRLSVDGEVDTLLL